MHNIYKKGNYYNQRSCREATLNFDEYMHYQRVHIVTKKATSYI